MLELFAHVRSRDEQAHLSMPDPSFDMDAMTSRAIHAFSQSNGHGRGPKVVIEKVELNVSRGMGEVTWKKRSDELRAQIMDKIAELVDQS